jgi:integrase/recombinase XerD
MLLTDAVRRHLNAMTAAGRSPHTLRGAKSALKELVAFLGTVDITNVEQMTHDGLLRYREALSWRLTDKGTPLSARSQRELLGHLRAFCRWMVEQDWFVSDPFKRIPNPRKPQQLPKAILDETEVARILAQPDLRTASGYRDRVILEVLYSSAIRREEAAHLRLEDVDTGHGFLIVRQGKNRKDRAVPIGAAVCVLLQTYIAGVRADWPGADRDRHRSGYVTHGRVAGRAQVCARGRHWSGGFHPHLPSQLRDAYAARWSADPASAGNVGSSLD